MKEVCELGNHIATYVEGSWGICGAMVCAWLNKVKAKVPVKRKEDIGTTGSLILAQHGVMKRDTDAGRLHLFRKFGLGLGQTVEYNAMAEPRYGHRSFAASLAAPGNYYASIVWFHEDEPCFHAIGVSSTASEWQLCDPNWSLWQTIDKNDFITTLAAHLEYHDVVTATSFKLL